VKNLATDILQTTDFLIVVVNYTMMGTTSEHEMWASLGMLRGDLLGEHRLLLVVNKFDQVCM
jgi:hypothetical protein